MIKLPERTVSFEEWFETEFRKRPTDKTVKQLLDEINEHQVLADSARYMLNAVQRWVDYRYAALKVWEAKVPK